MKNLVKGVLLTLVVAFATNCAMAQILGSNKVLVTIGEEKVTTNEFKRVYEKNNSQEDLYEEGKVKEYLDLYINFKLKVLEAEALKMDTTRAFIKELNGYRSQLAKPYFVDETVNDQLLKEAYDHMKKDIRASHILLMFDENSTPEDTLRVYNEIVKIREEILNGKDFEEAAIEYSNDPSARDREEIPNQQRFSKGNKGDLGYFTVFNMVYPFEEAAYNTSVNEVSEIVRTKFGYHLVKVTDIKEAMGNAEVAHIYVALRPNATKEDSARKAEKINNIYSKIQEGMAFEDAVIEYSEDKGSINNQGRLSKFTCNRVVPEFVLVVDELEIDEISAPVKTDYGFHIIKLINIDKPGTFKDEEPKLKERLAKDQRSQKSEEAVIVKIKNDNKFKLYPKAITEVYTTIDSTVVAGKYESTGLTEMSLPVIRLKKDKYTQDDFIKFVQKKQKPQDNMTKEVYLNQLFTEFEKDCCIDFMDSHLEEHYPDFKNLVQEYHDGILLFNLTDDKVWTKAVKDSIGLQEFFDKNRADYNWEERVDATVYKLKDKSQEDKVRVIIERFDNDGDVAKALAEDSIKTVRIAPDTFERGDDKYVDMVKWVPNQLDIINSDVEELTVFVKINKVLPPQPKELDEARGIVTADYQTYLEKEWIVELKNKYPVSVNEEVLSSIIESGK